MPGARSWVQLGAWQSQAGQMLPSHPRSSSGGGPSSERASQGVLPASMWQVFARLLVCASWTRAVACLWAWPATERVRCQEVGAVQGAEDLPLILKAVKGHKVHRPPVWMMRQAGRYMKVWLRLLLWSWPGCLQSRD